MATRKSSSSPTKRSTPKRPERTDYRPVPQAIKALPFVCQFGKPQQWSNWKVLPTSDYGLACTIGRDYAAHFVQYLKDNPGMVWSNLLGNIAADIDFKDVSARGYWVGFFSHLERYIYAGAVKADVFADIDRLDAKEQERKAHLERERDAEAANG